MCDEGKGCVAPTSTSDSCPCREYDLAFVFEARPEHNAAWEAAVQQRSKPVVRYINKGKQSSCDSKVSHKQTDAHAHLCLRYVQGAARGHCVCIVHSAACAASHIERRWQEAVPILATRVARSADNCASHADAAGLLCCSRVVAGRRSGLGQS